VFCFISLDVQISHLQEHIERKNDMITQLDHSTNSIRQQMLSLKNSFASVNDELTLKDKAVS